MNQRRNRNALRRAAVVAIVVAIALTCAVGLAKKEKLGAPAPKPTPSSKKSETPKRAPKPAQPASKTPAKPAQTPKPAPEKKKNSCLPSLFGAKTPQEDLDSQLADAQKARERKRCKDAMTAACKVVSTIREREYARVGDGQGGTAAAYAALETRARKLAEECGKELESSRVSPEKPLFFKF